MSDRVRTLVEVEVVVVAETVELNGVQIDRSARRQRRETCGAERAPIYILSSPSGYGCL